MDIEAYADVQCSDCGQDVPMDAEACPQCGRPRRSQQKTRLPLQLVTVALLAGMVFLLFGRAPQQSNANTANAVEANDTVANSVATTNTETDNDIGNYSDQDDGSNEVDAVANSYPTQIGKDIVLYCQSYDPCAGKIDTILRHYRTLEGQDFLINMTSINPALAHGVQGYVVMFYNGDIEEIRNSEPLYFDCKGGFADAHYISNMQFASPGSIADQMAKIMCPIGEQRRAEDRAAAALPEARERERALQAILERKSQEQPEYRGND